MPRGWETCKVCGTFDKVGAHDDCLGVPDEWRACDVCGTVDDMESHAH